MFGRRDIVFNKFLQTLFFSFLKKKSEVLFSVQLQKKAKQTSLLNTPPKYSNHLIKRTLFSLRKWTRISVFIGQTKNAFRSSFKFQVPFE